MLFTVIPSTGLWGTIAGFFNTALSAIGNALSDNVVRVRSESDLPATVDVGGVMIHRLEAKEYILDNDVVITNPVGPPGPNKKATIKAVNRAILTYNGAQGLFYDTDAQGAIEVEGLTEFRSPGSEMWHLTAVTGSFSFQATGGACRFTECESLGVVEGDGASGFSVFFGTISDFNQGLVGTNLNFFEVNTLFVFGNNAVDCVYFTIDGVQTTGSSNIDTVTTGSGSNETFLYINPEIQPTISSVNIRAVSPEGDVDGTVFGAGSLTNKSAKVIAEGNSFLGNTRPGGLLSLTNNVQSTAVGTVNAKVKATGTYTSARLSQFVMDVNGRLTSKTARVISNSLRASVTLQPTVATGVAMRAYIAKNGVPILDSGHSSTAAATKGSNVCLEWAGDTAFDDYYEIFVENETNGKAIYATDVVFVVS